MYTPEEIREAGLDDFRVFLTQIWDFLNLPEPTPIQLDIAWWLQHGPKRLVIMAFRGVGKSWITTTFALWQLFKNPEFKVEVVSASGELSDDISQFALRLIKEMPILSFLKPKPWQRSSLKSFDVGPARPAKSPSMKSAGITGQITGTRADMIIADDVEIPKNSYTHHLREKLAKLTTEFSDILKPDDDDARIIYLGTPQVEESLYPKLKDRGYTLLTWPAEVPENTDVYAGRLAPFIQKMVDDGVEPGTPTAPTRFPRGVLEEKKAEHGKSGYELQYMLNTEPSSVDKHPLKLGDLIVTDLDPEIAPVKMVWGQDRNLVIDDLPAAGFAGDRYHRPAWISEERKSYGGTVMAIDPSGRGKDELGYSIVSHLHSMLYLRDIGGYRDGYSEQTLKGLAAKAARHNVNTVIAEENYGGGMFNKLFQPYLAKYLKEPCLECKADGKTACDHTAGRFDDEWNAWSTGMKERRILSTLEPVVQQHRLVVDRRIIEKDNELQKDGSSRPYSFVYQFTRMHNERGALPHEDRLESLAMACQFWVDRMDQDRDRAVEAHREELMDQEIKDFLNYAGINDNSRNLYYKLP